MSEGRQSIAIIEQIQDYFNTQNWQPLLSVKVNGLRTLAVEKLRTLLPKLQKTTDRGSAVKVILEAVIPGNDPVPEARIDSGAHSGPQIVEPEPGRMAGWAYFVIVWLPAAAPPPFLASRSISSKSWNFSIFASQPLTYLDATLLRWRVGSVYQCVAHSDVVFSPMGDPFQRGRVQ